MKYASAVIVARWQLLIRPAKFEILDMFHEKKNTETRRRHLANTSRFLFFYKIQYFNPIGQNWKFHTKRKLSFTHGPTTLSFSFSSPLHTLFSKVTPFSRSLVQIPRRVMSFFRSQFFGSMHPIVELRIS